MKTYFCKYSLITKSRAGSYVYKCKDNVEVPEDVENVKMYISKKLKDMQTLLKDVQLKFSLMKRSDIFAGLVKFGKHMRFKLSRPVDLWVRVPHPAPAKYYLQ